MQEKSTIKDKFAFWRDKRVIVTGGAGFLGSYVVQKLYQRGVAEVIAPRHADYDLRDLTAIRQLLHDTGTTNHASIPTTYSNGSNGHHSPFPAPHSPVDMVIHLAAHVGGIEANRTHPAEFFYDNLMMGVQLLHESWRAGVAKFVAIGTICAYPKFASIPFREEELWNGYPEETNAPYGLAKKMMLVQSQSYRAQYDYNSIYLLPVNLYGPGDNFDLTTSHVIPALIRKCVEANASTSSAAGATSSAAGATSSAAGATSSAAGATSSAAGQIVAWGDGSPTREFLYVEDAAEGILLAAEHYDDSAPVNLGSSYEISIKELTETIARLTGFTGKIVWDTSKPNGQPRRKLDVSRAQERFGFMAETSFEEGLRRTIGWYETQKLQRSPEGSPDKTFLEIYN